MNLVHQVDEVVSRILTARHFLNDFIDVPNFAAFTAEDAQLVGKHTEQESQHGDRDRGLIRVARVVGDPNQGLHTNDHLGETCHEDGRDEVVLARVAQLIDRLQVGVDCRILTPLIALPECFALREAEVEEVQVVMHG